jgi:predicted RNase H-like nuclease
VKVVGIDRCRNAWLVAVGEEALSSVSFRVEVGLSGFLAELEAERALVVVDVPIGLSENRPRAVDLAARRLLRAPRSSSVFPAPTRAALAGETHEDASRLNAEASGKKLSVQAFGILGGIRELDGFMTPERQEWVREGHPEVTFAVLSGGKSGIAEPKRTPEGQRIRLDLLRARLDVPDVAAIRRQFGHGFVGSDDVIDALAMLVSASRLHYGDASILPEDGPELDARSLRMEMVA